MLKKSPRFRLELHRSRRIQRRLLFILIIGVACSFFQAWGSIYYLTVHARFKQGITALIPGQLYPRLEWTNGWDEIRPDGLSIGYHRAEYPFQITTVFGNTFRLSSQERLFSWDGRPLGSINPDPAGPSPTWSTPSRIRWDDTLINNEPVYYFYDIAAGWPFRSFWGSRRLYHNQYVYNHHRFYWCLPLGAPKMDPHQDPLFPYRPLPGLLGNTALYGIGAYAMFTLIGRAFIAVRTDLRRRRGRCTRCAYQLDALSICPECGTTSAKARPAPRR
jgi:hypothetical protein